jgi:hypothetical protein
LIGVCVSFSLLNDRHSRLGGGHTKNRIVLAMLKANPKPTIRRAPPTIFQSIGRAVILQEPLSSKYFAAQASGMSVRCILRMAVFISCSTSNAFGYDLGIRNESVFAVSTIEVLLRRRSTLVSVYTDTYIECSMFGRARGYANIMMLFLIAVYVPLTPDWRQSLEEMDRNCKRRIRQ